MNAERRQSEATTIQDLEKEIDEIKTDVKELLEIFHASKGFIKVLGWIGVGVKWILTIAAVCGLVYTVAKK